MEITWQPITNSLGREFVRLYIGNTWIETIRDKKDVDLIKENITQYTTTQANIDDLKLKDK